MTKDPHEKINIKPEGAPDIFQSVSQIIVAENNQNIQDRVI